MKVEVSFGSASFWGADKEQEQRFHDFLKDIVYKLATAGIPAVIKRTVNQTAYVSVITEFPLDNFNGTPYALGHVHNNEPRVGVAVPACEWDGHQMWVVYIGLATQDGGFATYERFLWSEKDGSIAEAIWSRLTEE